MNTHYGVRTGNKRTHGTGQYALRNTVYGLLNTRTWKASLIDSSQNWNNIIITWVFIGSWHYFYLYGGKVADPPSTMLVTLSTLCQRLRIRNSSRSRLMSLVSSVSSITGTQFRQFRRLQQPSFVSLVYYRKPVSSVSFRQFRFVSSNTESRSQWPTRTPYQRFRSISRHSLIIVPTVGYSRQWWEKASKWKHITVARKIRTNHLLLHFNLNDYILTRIKKIISHKIKSNISVYETERILSNL